MTSGLVAESIRERLGSVSADVPDLRLLVLFGSAAKGRTTARSDIDIALMADDVADLDALFLALAPRVKSHRLDLVDLRRAGPLLSFEVARSGILLFERSAGEFRRFQSLAARRYADTKKLRDAQQRSIQVFLSREPHA